MPASASSHHPGDILDRLASSDGEIKLKAIREVKNQIIGNRTKKLSYLKLGAVDAVASILAAAESQLAGSINNCESISSNILVQSAAALGSFACGFDSGVQAVLDAGAFPYLMKLLSSTDEKVVDAGARSLRMIYQSKLAPEYDFLQEENMEFLVTLLDSDNDNVSGLGASIITHSCRTYAEQKVLCDAGVLKKLAILLEGSLNQRDASLESLATVFKNNPDVIEKFAAPEGGKALSSIIAWSKDRYPRTRLLACKCLIVIRNTSPCFLQDVGIKTKLIHILLELLEDPGQVGDEASFVFSSLVVEKEDIQKLAFEANAINILYNHLEKSPLHSRRHEGLLLALADMCSKLEICRTRFLTLQGLHLVTDALTHASAGVRAASCVCLRSVSRSIKTLSAGHFMSDVIVIPLLQLLDDPSTTVQVAALSAITNIVVDFTTRKSTFIQLGGVRQLVQLSKSMDSPIRLNALWALRNLVFLADYRFKEAIFLELTASLLASFICDPEPSVQEQALALVCNLVDGCIDSVEYVFSEDATILNAVGRQLQNISKTEIGLQGMYVLNNVASGTEFHKEAVMHQLLQQVGTGAESFMIKCLQSHDGRLRTAAVWTIINLISPSGPSAYGRVVKLRNFGIISQIKSMVNDPCLDVKLRVRTVLEQLMTFGDSSK